MSQAAAIGSVSMVRALVEAGANPDHGCFFGGENALMQACAKGHLQVVRYLIEAHADLDKTNQLGDTALAIACFWGQVRRSEHGARHTLLHATDPVSVSCQLLGRCSRPFSCSMSDRVRLSDTVFSLTTEVDR